MGTSSNPEFVGTSDVAQVARLYVAAFDRLPDADGLQSWVQAMQGGLTQTQVATDFLGTPEGVAKFGGGSVQHFVTAVYTNVLGRAPDAAGSAFWANAIISGQISVGGVLASFANSPEFFAH